MNNSKLSLKTIGRHYFQCLASKSSTKQTIHPLLARDRKMQRALRAHKFGKSSLLQVDSMGVPRPGPNEILVETRAIGVNPIDAYLRSGVNEKIPLPFLPGMDCAGVVEEIGPDVTSFKKGDRVYLGGVASGTYAEYVVCSERQARLLPNNQSFAVGAALFTAYATAYRALVQRARGVANETVLIHGGSGSVGLAAIQFAKRRGLRIIATAGTETGLQLVRDFGADFALNHSKPSYMQEIQKITENKGVDLVVEMLANVNLAQDLMCLTRTGGRIAVVGNKGSIQVNPREIMKREADVLGVTLANCSESDMIEIFDSIDEGLNEGYVHPLLNEREFFFEDAAAAHDAVMQTGVYGKVIIIPPRARAAASNANLTAAMATTAAAEAAADDDDDDDSTSTPITPTSMGLKRIDISEMHTTACTTHTRSTTTAATDLSHH